MYDHWMLLLLSADVPFTLYCVIDLLYLMIFRVMKDLDRNSSGFWSEVADKMENRSEAECFKFHQSEQRNQEKQKQAKKAKENEGMSNY